MLSTLLVLSSTRNCRYTYTILCKWVAVIHSIVCVKTAVILVTQFECYIYSSLETRTLLADSEKKYQGFRNKVPEETSPHPVLPTQDQRLDVEQDQLPSTSTGTSSGSRQETETCMFWECHTHQQPLQNHLSGHFGGWATPWSAEEMLDGHCQKVDILSMPEQLAIASCRKKKKTGRESLLNRPSYSHIDPIGKGQKWTELNIAV